VNLSDKLTTFGDPDRLVQVLSNLLSNAAKFTPKGGHITLTGTRDDRDVTLCVVDNGIGIDAESLPKIFEMFSQAGRALDRPSLGLGIGLALARALVDLHGGSLTARSDGPGTGAELTVRLPVHEVAPVAAVPADVPAASRTVSASRILVVDDHVDAADALAFLLRAAGHAVETAHDGLEALDMAAVFRPEIVLLDLGMPKLDGYAAARKIREQAWAKDVVLIALTGWGQPRDRQRTAKAGFNAHLVKPVGMEELLGMIVDLKPATTRR